MMDIYDRYGYREAQLQRLVDDLSTTYMMLKDVCEGTVDPKRVVFTDNRWTLNPELEPTPLVPSEQ